jgi:hypothetical protein
MIKLNALTHELEKPNFRNKSENTIILGINQNEVILVQVGHGYEQLHKPFRSVE